MSVAVGFYTEGCYHLYLKGYGVVLYGMFVVPTSVSNVYPRCVLQRCSAWGGTQCSITLPNLNSEQKTIEVLELVKVFYRCNI